MSTFSPTLVSTQSGLPVRVAQAEINLGCMANFINTSTVAPIATLTAEVATLNTEVASHTSTIGVLVTEVTSNIASINTLNTEVAANIASINTLNTEVAANTTNITSNTTSIGTLNTTVAGHTTSINTLNTEVAANTTNISSNTTSIGTLNTTVAGHTTSINTLNTEVAANTTNITSNTTSIGTLNTTVTSQASTISSLSSSVTTLNTFEAAVNAVLNSNPDGTLYFHNGTTYHSTLNSNTLNIHDYSGNDVNINQYGITTTGSSTNDQCYMGTGNVIVKNGATTMYSYILPNSVICQNTATGANSYLTSDYLSVGALSFVGVTSFATGSCVFGSNTLTVTSSKSALQSYAVTATGNINAININNISKGVNIVVEIYNSTGGSITVSGGTVPLPVTTPPTVYSISAGSYALLEINCSASSAYGELTSY